MRGYNEEDLQSNDNLLKSIKEQRGHAERRVNDFINQFEGDTKFNDQLDKLGSKYEQRLKEFQQIRYQNTDLKLETRKLQEQISLLRNSLQESGWRDDDIVNRCSAEPSKPESTYNCISSEPTARETMKSKIMEIQKLKENALAIKQEESQYEDDILKSMLELIKLANSTQTMYQEIKSAGCQESGEQMVKVPRKRYEFLIELYSLKMAEISATRLQKHLNRKSEGNLDLEQKEDTEERKKEKYENIVGEMELGSMEVFFRRLAERFGFEKEWERYHTENKEESIALKARIDGIILPRSVRSPIKNEAMIEKDGPYEEAKGLQVDTLRAKLNSLVKMLPFNQRQRDCWTELSEKIYQDKLFSMPLLLNKIKQSQKDKETEIIADYASITSHLFTTIVSQLEELLISKYRKGCVRTATLELKYKEETLRESLETEMKQGQSKNVIGAAKKLADQTSKNIFQMLKEQLVFTSVGEIRRSLGFGR